MFLKRIGPRGNLCGRIFKTGVVFISSVLNVLNNIWPYLVAVLLFLVLIIIHEFGHFIAAKLLGVKVNEFAVGFGPKLFSKKKGETEYKINLIPLGGYCAMEGEDEESSDERAFCKKSAWRRFIIVAMGAIFNLLLGVLLVSFTLIPSKQFTTTKIAAFDENAISEETGLRIDDKILKVDGRKIYTTYDLSYAFTNVKNGSLDIEVERDGAKKLLKDVTFAITEEDDFTYINVDFKVYPQEKTFKSFISQTFKMTFSYCAVIYRSLFDLIGGKYGISAVSGPVGVTAAIGSAAKASLKNLIPIMALITINLGLFNLLPIPALDGGRLLFIFIEMVTRKKIPAKYEATIHAIGFIILILFMLAVTAKDIRSLIFR